VLGASTCCDKFVAQPFMDWLKGSGQSSSCIHIIPTLTCTWRLLCTQTTQVWFGVVPEGPTGVRLNSSYATRSSARYLDDLGHSIANFARVVPDGLLVFFPSYGAMTAAIDHWKTPPVEGGCAGTGRDGTAAVAHGLLLPRWQLSGWPGHMR